MSTEVKALEGKPLETKQELHKTKKPSVRYSGSKSGNSQKKTHYIIERYDNDPNPPLIRYVKEGKELDNQLYQLKEEYGNKKSDEEQKEYRNKIKSIYKNAKPSQIKREFAIAFDEKEDGKVVYGAAVFRRDSPNEMRNRNIRFTALARYYQRPVTVQLPENYKTMSLTDKIVFLRKQIYTCKTRGEKIREE